MRLPRRNKINSGHRVRLRPRSYDRTNSSRDITHQHPQSRAPSGSGAASAAGSVSSMAPELTGGILHVEVPPSPRGWVGELGTIECPYFFVIHIIKLIALGVSPIRKSNGLILADDIMSSETCSHMLHIYCGRLERSSDRREKWNRHETQRLKVEWFFPFRIALNPPRELIFTHMSRSHDTAFKITS